MKSMNNWQRFLIIMQLCFAFSVILWYATQPFMGEYFSLRSRMLLYEYVMGNSDFLKKQTHVSDKLERNAQRFENLDLSQREAIKDGYRNLQAYAQRSPLSKILDGMKILFLRIPTFQMAWVVFATIIGIMLLLNKPGAKHAAWILPLIAIVYAIDNQSTGLTPMVEPDAGLFPSENVIVQEYLPSQSGIMVDKNLLQQGWNNYLVVNWSPEDSLSIPDKLESAEFNFTAARLMLLYKEAPNHWLNSLREKSSYLLLSIYFIWNLFFAWAVTYRQRKDLRQ